MTHTYQNTDFSVGRSVFVDTSSEDTQAIFTAKKLSVTVPNGKVKMARAKLTLRRDNDVSQCDTECLYPVTESVSLEFSVLDGGANLASLRTELNRVLDLAISNFSMGKGLVPPSYATFAEE